jgi:hypothetical protein
MPYVAFYKRFPQIATRETRSVTILRESDFGLPPGDYGFVEMFCDEPGCDCRRVFFYVVTPDGKEPEAVITYGWEPREFYARWMRYGTPRDVDELRGPALNLMSPQSNLAPALLRLFKTVLLPDDSYIDRVKSHYRMFRESIDGQRSGKAARAKPKRGKARANRPSR